VTLGVMGLERGLHLAKVFSRVPGVAIKFVCDVDQNRAGRAQDELQASTRNKPQIVGDFRKILDDPEVDALVCAAPNHWHGPATILACAAGKHVYVEKPCSHNPHEGELMVQAAGKHQRVVQLGTQRRSSPSIRQAMGMLRDGKIGRVYLSKAWYNSLRGSIGRGREVSPPPQLDYELWQGPAPRRPYVDNRIPYNWHWFWHWGNGELGNNGVHGLDLCRWGLGVDFPIRVTSAGGRYRFEDDQETPDTQAVAFDFEGRKSITWEGLSTNKHGSNRFVAFYGETGAMELDLNGAVRVFDPQDKLIEEIPGQLDDVDHAANFIEAIRNEQPGSLNAEISEGHRSTLLCHLGNIAQRAGRSLTCAAEDGKIAGDPDASALWKREYQPGWEPTV
jgi:predicted dehydrogenase